MKSSLLFQYALSRFLRFVVTAEILILTALCLSVFSRKLSSGAIFSSTQNATPSGSAQTEEKKYMKWVDFSVPDEALRQALRLDVDSFTSDCHLNWIELLAYLAARYGGDFSRFRTTDMDTLAERIKGGESMQTLTENMKYYAYYLEAYTAVLGGMVGTYQDYDDFGVSRSYGFKRQHLGHDMMGQVGTPVIAVESGYVEAIGWNQYGGWRLGIRSFDKKRYYYYAHLRKNYPYHKALKEGSIVQAGDVIGYLGRTGYSRTENTNNIDEPHLHFGLQLIFDESQKDGNNEIWIDCYQLVRFLQLNRSETKKDPETKEYSRVLEMRDPAIP